MAFNRTLWYATGNQIGREARAMMNAGNGFSTFWAPGASPQRCATSRLVRGTFKLTCPRSRSRRSH